ncbi:porin [Roseateles cellulosilyticus]|uniref:Porin n=1 Tax=Pelomonas cellulosilytica TaxID=2906762 RepID=A0ABS8XUH1_9BURK|nr:porin [Pelomonas sp. P8]MCE4554354.1 porin [Pelomonas sp. P8]
MKVRQRWAAFATAALLPMGCAADTLVYGRLNVALEAVELAHSLSRAALHRESNNRSVLGFQGAEDLGDGYRALFQIEGALAIDTGGGGSFSNRDTRVGLSAPWGQLFLGHWTTPYLQATSGFDPFYPTTAGYMALMGNGSASTTNHVIDRASFDRRQQNVVQYASPAGSSFSARLAYAANDGDRGPGGSRPDLWSAALSWDHGPLSFVLAHEIHRAYQGPGLNDSGTKVGWAGRWGDWRVATAIEQLRYALPSGQLRRNAAYASVTRQFGAGSLRLGVTRAGNGVGPAGVRVGAVAAGPRTGARQWTLGYDYSFSRRTGLYVYASRIANQSSAAYDFAINGLGVSAGESPQVLAAGIRHSF